MIIRSIIAIKKALDSIIGKVEDAKDKFDDVKDKIARYNIKRVKAVAITMSVICLAMSASALAVGIVALVKSCKKSKSNDKCGYLEDDDYDFSLDDHKIAESDIPSDDSDEELSF